MAGSAVGDQTASFLGDFHHRKILEVLTNNTAYYALGDKIAIAQMNGNVITYHTASNLALATQLTEGVQPNAVFMTGGTKTANLVQFGQVTRIADVMAKTAIVNLMDQALARLGASAAKTIDRYVQRRLTSDSVTTDSSIEGTYNYENHLSSWYKGNQGGISAIFLSGVRQDIESSAVMSGFMSLATMYAYPIQDIGLTINKIRRLVSILQADNVSPYDGGDYVMVMHPNTVWQLRKDPEWASWNQAQYAEKMFNGEVGKIEGVRIIQTTNQYKTKYACGAFASMYTSIILGKQCFAITELEGEAGIKTSVVPFSQKDSGNVLAQNCSLGWIWTGVVKVLDPKQGYGLITFDNV
jgi:N4-gp56 family major capsid protein